MTPIAEILPFGVSGEVFWNPEPMADAMSAMEVLPLADLARMQAAYDSYEPVTSETLALLGRAHIAAAKAGDREAADQAKQAIAQIVRNTDRMFWSSTIASRIKSGEKGDKRVSKEWYFQRISRALGPLALKALLGDHEALIGLIEISETQTRVSGAAKIILQKFSRLKTLVHPNDRLELAQKSAALLAEEYNQVMQAIHEGKTKLDKELGEKLLAMEEAYNYLLIAIGETEKRKKADWDENSEASAIMHGGVERVLVGFRNLGDCLATGRSIKVSYLQAFSHVVKDDLTSVVHSAFLQNQLLAMAKGVKLEMNVSKGITIAEYDERKKLEIALVELVNNALKYCDDSKAEKKITVFWDPAQQRLVVKDNGIGIKDTEAIWRDGFREAPAKAQGTGKGLAIVKKDLEAIGWKIAVVSQLGRGSAFFLTPPKGRLAYSDDYFAVQIDRAKFLFRTIYFAVDRFRRGLGELQENEVDGLDQLWRFLNREMFVIGDLFPRTEDPRFRALLSILNSSSTYLPLTVRNYASVAVNKLREGKWSWAEAMERIEKTFRLRECRLIGEHGYQFDSGRREAGDYLVWLLRYPKPQESWEEGRWVLRYPKSSDIDPNAIVFKTLFEVLGWEMTTAEEGEHLVVRVNFGATRM